MATASSSATPSTRTQIIHKIYSKHDIPSGSSYVFLAKKTRWFVSHVVNSILLIWAPPKGCMYPRNWTSQKPQSSGQIDVERCRAAGLDESINLTGDYACKSQLLSFVYNFSPHKRWCDAEYYNGDLMKCERSYDKLGRTAQILQPQHLSHRVSGGSILPSAVDLATVLKRTQSSLFSDFVLVILLNPYHLFVAGLSWAILLVTIWSSKLSIEELKQLVTGLVTKLSADKEKSSTTKEPRSSSARFPIDNDAIPLKIDDSQLRSRYVKAISKDEPPMSWAIFKGYCKLRFGPPRCVNSFGKLANLKQQCSGIINSYILNFWYLLSRADIIRLDQLELRKAYSVNGFGPPHPSAHAAPPPLVHSGVSTSSNPLQLKRAGPHISRLSAYRLLNKKHARPRAFVSIVMRPGFGAQVTELEFTSACTWQLRLVTIYAAQFFEPDIVGFSTLTMRFLLHCIEVVWEGEPVSTPTLQSVLYSGFLKTSFTYVWVSISGFHHIARRWSNTVASCNRGRCSVVALIWAC
ncbi:hypothetical protein PHJA_002466700 [Phtheirospermum japonicum]|uniref:Uncharacterized protein n=1 Tax=Phtheirospermum japonicum TaxID=374723 RepID=A0A830D090_9LAMI|nr:hypothetical protein PHJA_002466700 [Phtheirospermum japonicum]